MANLSSYCIPGLGLALLLSPPHAWTQKKIIDIPRVIASSSGDSSAVKGLLFRLDDRDPFVSGESAEALSRIGSSAVPGLIGVLRNGTAPARWSATIALAKMGAGASAAVPALTDALADTSALVRWGSIAALENTGIAARSAIPAMLDALSDPDEDVRHKASHALDDLDSSAVESNREWRSVADIMDVLTPRLMDECHVPGVAVALISGRALVRTRCYGTMDAGTGEPVTPQTMFEACSMSKPVFACLAMMLVEQGKLGLDTPLADYLALSSLRGQPESKRITARMVLSHTSGLPNWRKGEEERDGPISVLFAPGTKFGYSGEGFFYLQKVVGQITHQPLDVCAQRMLFDPLGMSHATFAWQEKDAAITARGHDAGGHPLEKSRYTHANAAYTLYISAEDYARFLLALLSPGTSPSHFLGQNLVDSMFSHQAAVATREPFERPGKAGGRDVFCGLGWCINTTLQGDIICHSGSNRTGFRCYSQLSPSRGSGIVIMTNGAGGTDLWTRLISRVGNF